ncbi:MAG TPA: HesA/MoeB/ThiF family protein [Chitinophagaceae bacterium]
MNTNNSYERYHRQILLKGFGEEGQQKLLQAKVLVIGAGGLGCPALQYLTAAGVGTIGIVDDDVVALSNLHRQVLYSVNDIGLSKADTAAKVLSALNPDISITTYNERLTTANALDIINAYDLIIDGTDNFASRYMINDACVLSGKPLVYGAISQYEGQVAVFNFKNDNNDPVNYRDLFPEPPKDGEVLNCAEAGVLGILPGIIGTMMANETIKLITGIGESLINQLLTYNALANQVYTLGLSSRKETRSLIPADEAAFKQINYDWLCASPSTSFEIDVERFTVLLQEDDTAVIDVREWNEKPVVDEFAFTQIPLSELQEKMTGIKENAVIFFCQSGKRSLQAAQLLFNTFGETKKVYSLQGGLLQWNNRHVKKSV